MLIVLSIISSVLMVLGIFLVHRNDTGYPAVIIGAMIFLGVIVGFCENGAALVQGRYIDSQIAMYLEENAVIEQNVADSINAYLAHELGIMETLKTNPEASVTIVAAYPTLNSSELIAEQIGIYNSNNQKIKELKEKKLLLGVNRWWIYFGS